MMKLKLEPKLLTKSSKESVFDEVIDQTKVTSSYCLLTPHLTLNSSTQVPIESSMNSKGFFTTNLSNVFVSELLHLIEKSLDLSGKKKASLIPVHSLFVQESFFMIFTFRHLVNRDSSLSSSTLIKPN